VKFPNSKLESLWLKEKEEGKKRLFVEGTGLINSLQEEIRGLCPVYSTSL
jgi:hypothetical protein